MDITTGNTAGRDALRASTGADDLTWPDATLQQCWDVAVDVTSRYIRPGYSTDAPAAVVEFVLNVGAVVLRIRDSGGDVSVYPDGTFQPGPELSSYKLRRMAATYAPYTVTPRVIA